MTGTSPTSCTVRKNRMRALLILLALVGTAYGLPVTSTVAEAGRATILIINTTNTPHFTVFKLEEPKRLYIDISDVDIRPENLVHVETPAVLRARVEQYVSGVDGDGLGRIVLDLVDNTSYRVRALRSSIEITVSVTRPRRLR